MLLDWRQMGVICPALVAGRFQGRDFIGICGRPRRQQYREARTQYTSLTQGEI